MMQPGIRCPPTVERSSFDSARCRWQRTALTVPFSDTISHGSSTVRTVTPEASRSTARETHPTAESTTPAAMLSSRASRSISSRRSSPRRSLLHNTSMDTASFVSPVIVAVRRKNASAANGGGMSAFARVHKL